jgi:hypothetical protein
MDRDWHWAERRNTKARERYTRRAEKPSNTAPHIGHRGPLSGPSASRRRCNAAAARCDRTGDFSLFIKALAAIADGVKVGR